MEKYESFDTMTTTMLNEFVEKTLAHERARKGSIETTQEVEIYFNFVGRYVPPHFGEVNLTPEKREALRKKEERKDRLHQNYSRRKANGKQKAYEDRIKTEKRRQMETKKAALRAENMAKGIYTIAANLPRQEPHRGTPPVRVPVI